MKTPLQLKDLSDIQLEELRHDMFVEMSRRDELKRIVPPKNVVARLKKLQKHFEEDFFNLKINDCTITISRYYDGYSEISDGLCYSVEKFKGPKIFAPILNQDVPTSEIKRLAPEIYKEDLALAKEYEKLSREYEDWREYF